MTIPASDVIFTPPGAPTQQPTVQDRLAQSVSLKDFGAVGDAATDDTAAIQAAVDYCTANRLDLFVPVGAYLISSPGIQIGSSQQPKFNLVMRGENGPNGGGSQFFASSLVNLFTMSFAGQIAFYNIAFVNGNHQIHCPDHVADLRFEECIFAMSKYTGIGFYADGDTERVYFIRCLFQFGQYGFFHSGLSAPDGSSANFDQSHISECEFRGQQFNALYSAQVVGGFNTVRDCHFTNIGQHTINFEGTNPPNIANWVFDNLTTEDAAGWLKNSYPVTGGSIAAANTQLTVIDPTGFYAGSVVSVFQGGNPPLVAKVTAISGSTLTLDAAASVTVENVDVTSVIPTGSITSGTNILTVDYPDLLFQGDVIVVPGAGAGDGALTTTISAPPSGNVLTLDTPASTSVTNAIVVKLANPTTGSIAGTPGSPSSRLTVASTSGIVVGDVLTIQGAAKGPQDFERGEDLSSTVIAVDRAAKIITLGSPAFGTVTNAEVTRARYDFIHHDPISGGNANLYINCNDGYNVPGTIGRYSIYGEGRGAAVNCRFTRPIYNGYVNMIGGISPWRRSALHVPYGLAGTSIGPDTISDASNGNFVTSPWGRDLKLSMLDSAKDGTGTFGTFSVVQAKSDNLVTQLEIDSSGNVGVGVNPAAPFHVANYGNNSSLRVNHSSGASGAAGGWHLSAYYGNVETGYIDSELSNGAAGSEASVLRFGTIGSGMLAERMRIDAGGNVGIGTGPTYKLDVLGTSGTNEVIAQVKNAANHISALALTSGTQGSVMIETSVNSAGDFAVATGITPGSGTVLFYGNTSGYTRAGSYRPRTIASETLSTDRLMTNDGSVQMIMGDYGSGNGQIGTQSNHQLDFYTNKLAQMHLTQNGYLGIGGITSTARFYSSGGSVKSAYVRQTDGLSSAGYFQQEGNNYALQAIALSASYANAVMDLTVLHRGDASSYNFFTCFNSSGYRFKLQGDGNALAHGTFQNNSLDYAEYFESAGGSTILIGTCVVLSGEKIRAATTKDKADDIIGVVRPKGKNSASTVVGGTAWNEWNKRRLTDDFGQKVWEEYEVVEWFEGEGDKRQARSYEIGKVPSDVVVPPSATTKTMERPAENPNYDQSATYVPRDERSEWHVVGLMGQIPILKGQPTRSSWRKMKDISATAELWFVR